MTSLAALVLGIAIVTTGMGEGLLGGPKITGFLLAGVVSFAISFAWYRYLVWLDMFEAEHRGQLLLTFLLACGTTLLVHPATALILEYTPLRLDGTAWNDWWYSLLAIGAVEEITKLLPYIIVLLFTRWINEPFDHLFYASISALGFAFMENTLYLDESQLGAFNGRALTATVSHMFDSSIIGYGMAMGQYRTGKLPWMRLPLLLGLAALAHGFYDFWLLGIGRPWILTFIFYMVTLHLWVLMKNNLLNISPNYFRGAIRSNHTVRYRILSMFVVLFMSCAVLILWRSGREPAVAFLGRGMWDLAGTLVLLTMSFSSFVPVRGHIAPIRPPSNLRKWFLPRFDGGSDLSGELVSLKLSSRMEARGAETYLEPHLPVQGRLIERFAVGQETDWFLFEPERPLPLGASYDAHHFLLQLHTDHAVIPEDAHVLMRMRAFRTPIDLSRASVEPQRLSETAFRLFARRAGTGA